MIQVRVKTDEHFTLTLVDWNSKIRIEHKDGHAFDIDAGDLAAAIEVLRRVAQGESKDG